jgi:hypothetical protein
MTPRWGSGGREGEGGREWVQNSQEKEGIDRLREELSF